jgi:type I restriction enzyme S subunit
MEKKKNTPKLRFPEFTGEWEEKRLGEIAEFSKGKGVSKADIAEDGKTECIRYGELYTRYNEVIKEVYSKTNLDKSNLVLSEANDVIIPASGETQIDISTASCITKSGVALGGDLNIIKTPNNGVFLSYYLNNKKKIEIASLAQGISVIHLYSSQLSLLNLKLPFLVEQTKIATFLTAVDEKLTQLKKKKTLLEQYKKGVMQKLFSQELRFKDDNNQDFPDWQEKTLGEVSQVKDGTHESPQYYECGFPFITSKNLMTDGNIDLENVSYINEDDFRRFNIRSNVEVNDILFAMIGTIGNPVLVRNDGFAIKNIALIKEKHNLLNIFLIHYMKGPSIKQQFFEQNTGGTQKFLSLGIIKKLIIDIPSLPEQVKIATFLSAIDEKISHSSAQIEKMEAWKKGLLQQMFC